MRILSRALLTLLLVAAPLPAKNATLSKEDVLAFFVLNCAYFGHWPAAIDIHTTQVLRIGVLGADPIGPALDAVADKARTSWFRQGRIEIRRATRATDLSGMHLVFVAGADRALEAEALRAFAGQPVLLVSDAPGFAARGGTLEARIENERLVFDLNLDLLQASGVELDSKMKIRAAGFIRAGRREPNTRAPAPGGTP